MESSSDERGAFFPFFIYFSETEFGVPILSYDPTRRPTSRARAHIEPPMSLLDERSDDDLVASKLRHLQAQVTALEAACSTRVDVLTRECDALRTENEALRTEVAALRDVDRTLLEGLLDDLAPIDTRGDDDHAADEARLEADRAMARALSLATTRVQPSRAAKRLKITEVEPDSDSDSDGPLGMEVRDEGRNKGSKGDDAYEPSVDLAVPVPRMYEGDARGRQFLLCKHALKKAGCPECQPVRRKKKGTRNKPPGSICEHGARRSTCTRCKGGAMCRHGKRKTLCQLGCKGGGGSICVHKRERYRCVLCGGGSICHHNRRRAQCKLCWEERKCEHGLEPTECADCVLLAAELAEFDSEESFERAFDE